MVMAEGGGDEGIEVGAIRFGISVDLSQFTHDLEAAEDLARSRAASIQQHFNSLSVSTGGMAAAQQSQSARAVDRIASQQLGLPGFDKAADLFKKKMDEVKQQRKLLVDEQAEILPSAEIPPPAEPSPVERTRRVKTRDYHTTETGAPEAVTPPPPVSQTRDVQTRDVRSSQAPQELPAPPQPSKVQVQVPPQIVAIPGPPPQPTFPLTPVNTASGQQMFVPSRASGPNQTQRQIPPSISGVPAAQRPPVHLPPVAPLTTAPSSPTPLPASRGAAPSPVASEASAPPVPQVGQALAAHDAALTSQVGESVSRQIEQVTASLKGQYVQFPGAAGARLSGKVTSENPDTGQLRVNLGGATVSVAREKVTPVGATTPAQPVVTPVAPVEAPATSRTPRAPRAPRAPAPVQEELPSESIYGPPTPRGAPAPKPQIMSSPPDLPRSGQPPRVFFEPPAEGALRQSAYVLAPTGIYKTDVAAGRDVRRSFQTQQALGQYFAGAEKIPPRQFPPYQRFLQNQEAGQQEQGEQEAARQARLAVPRAPTVRPGEVQNLPALQVPEDAEPAPPPPLAPPPPAFTRPSRTYEFQRGSVHSEIAVSAEGALRTQSREGERPVTGPRISRSDAAKILLDQRRRVRQRESGPSLAYTEPKPLRTGGQAQANQLHVIGENGPELFLPKTSGYVLSHEQSKRVIAEARAEGGEIEANLFGAETPKKRLPQFGEVQHKRRRAPKQPTGFDVSQPDLFAGRGIERGEGKTQAEQMSLAREEMRATGSLSMFDLLDEQPAPKQEGQIPLLHRGGRVNARQAGGEVLPLEQRPSFVERPPRHGSYGVVDTRTGEVVSEHSYGFRARRAAESAGEHHDVVPLGQPVPEAEHERPLTPHVAEQALEKLSPDVASTIPTRGYFPPEVGRGVHFMSPAGKLYDLHGGLHDKAARTALARQFNLPESAFPSTQLMEGGEHNRDRLMREAGVMRLLQMPTGRDRQYQDPELSVNVPQPITHEQLSGIRQMVSSLGYNRPGPASQSFRYHIGGTPDEKHLETGTGLRSFHEALEKHGFMPRAEGGQVSHMAGQMRADEESGYIYPEERRIKHKAAWQKPLWGKAEGGPLSGAASAFYNQERLREIQSQPLQSELLRSQIEDTFGIHTPFGEKPDLLQHLEVARGFLESPKEVLHNLIRQQPPVQIDPQASHIRGETQSTIGVYYPPGGGIGIAGQQQDIAATATHEAAHVLDFRKQRDTPLGAKFPPQASLGAFAQRWSLPAYRQTTPHSRTLLEPYLPSEYAATAPEEGFAEIIRTASAELRNTGLREELQRVPIRPLRTVRDTLNSGNVASYGPLRGASDILQRYAREHKVTHESGYAQKSSLISQAGLEDVFKPEYQRAIKRYAQGGFVAPSAEQFMRALKQQPGVSNVEFEQALHSKGHGADFEHFFLQPSGELLGSKAFHSESATGAFKQLGLSSADVNDEPVNAALRLANLIRVYKSPHSGRFDLYTGESRAGPPRPTDAQMRAIQRMDETAGMQFSMAGVGGGRGFNKFAAALGAARIKYAGKTPEPIFADEPLQSAREAVEAGDSPALATLRRALEKLGLPAKQERSRIEVLRSLGKEYQPTFSKPVARAEGGRADQIRPSEARRITLEHLRTRGLVPAQQLAEQAFGPAPVQVPSHLSGLTGFLGRQSERLAAGRLTIPQVGAAYLTTLSSIRAGELPRSTVERAHGALPQSVITPVHGKETVRPEDLFAHFLSTSAGKGILTDIQAGRVEEARRKIDNFRKSSPFGFPEFAPARRDRPETQVAFNEPKRGAFNIRNIAEATRLINERGRAGQQIEPLVERFQGVGAGKTGFLSQFLGSGQVPTLDVNALSQYFGSPRAGRIAQRSTAIRGHGAEIQQAVVQRHQEMAGLGYLSDVPRRQLPAVMHHALFNASKGAQTSHEAIFSLLESVGQARQAGGDVRKVFAGVPSISLAARQAGGHVEHTSISEEEWRKAGAQPISAKDFGLIQDSDRSKSTAAFISPAGGVYQLTGPYSSHVEIGNEIMAARGARPKPQRSAKEQFIEHFGLTRARLYGESIGLESIGPVTDKQVASVGAIRAARQQVASQPPTLWWDRPTEDPKTGFLKSQTFTGKSIGEIQHQFEEAGVPAVQHRQSGGRVDPRKAFSGLVERVYSSHRPYLDYMGSGGGSDFARGAAYAEGGLFKGVHVTDDPSRVTNRLRQALPVTQGRDEGKFGDLGAGLYSSDAPQMWRGRSRDKWEFLSDLKKDQRQKLADAILAHPNIAQKGYVTDTERNIAKRDLGHFVENGSTYGVTFAADQPYNVDASEPEFLKKIGITPGKQPQEVPIALAGRFAALKRNPTPQEAEQLQDPRYRLQGAFTKSGFSTYPQTVTFATQAVQQFGEFKRPTGSFKEFERRIAPRAEGGPVNPYMLFRQPGEGREPVSKEQFHSHAEAVLQRREEIERQLGELETQLAGASYGPQGRSGGVDQPPWAKGLTDQSLIQIAKAHGTNATKPGWWETVGLNVGSDEVKRVLSESNIQRGEGKSAKSPTVLRKQVAQLRHEQQQITSALSDLEIPAAQFYRAIPAADVDLPFGEPAAPQQAVTEPQEQIPAFIRRTREARAGLGAVRISRASEEQAAARPARPPRVAQAQLPTRQVAQAESGVQQFQTLSPRELQELTAGTELEGKLESELKPERSIRSEAPAVLQAEPEGPTEPPEFLRRARIARGGEGTLSFAPRQPGGSLFPVYTPTFQMRQAGREEVAAQIRRQQAPSNAPRRAIAALPAPAGVQLAPTPIAPRIGPSFRQRQSAREQIAAQIRQNLVRPEPQLAGMLPGTVPVTQAPPAAVPDQELAPTPPVQVQPEPQIPAPQPERRLGPLERAARARAQVQTASLAPETQAVLGSLANAQSKTHGREQLLYRLAEQLIKTGTKLDDVIPAMGKMGFTTAQAQPLRSLLTKAAKAAAPPPEEIPLSGAAAGETARDLEIGSEEIRRIETIKPFDPNEFPRTAATGFGPVAKPKRVPWWVAATPQQPVPPKIEQPALQYLQSNQAGLNQTQRFIRTALLSGKTFEELPAVLQEIGVEQKLARKEIEQVRVSATPKPEKQSGPGLLSRALSRIGIREQGGGASPEAEGVYLVGERGPEIFVPHAPGYVLAHQQAKKAISEGRAFAYGHNLQSALGKVLGVRKTGFMSRFEIGGRQAGGPVSANQQRQAIQFLENLPQRTPAEDVILRALRGGIQAPRIQSGAAQLPGVDPAQTESIFGRIRLANVPGGNVAQLARTQVGVVAQTLGQRVPTGLAGPQQERAEAQLLNTQRQEYQALVQLIAQYERLNGARRQDAEQTARQTAASRVLAARQEELVQRQLDLGATQREAETSARRIGAQEIRNLQAAPEQEGAPPRRGRVTGIFQSTQLIREVAALAGINLGFNVLVGLARQLHQVIADTVSESVNLERSTTQLGVAYGRVGAQQFTAGAQQARGAPLVTSTVAQFQQTAAQLQPLTQEYGLTNEQVQNLTRSSAQLATIWGTDQAQAASVLQNVIRGNIQAGDQFNLNLADQNGRIRGLNVTYQQLVDAVGQYAAGQQLASLATQRANEQVADFQANATPQVKALTDLNQSWTEFQNTLAEVAGGPITGFLQNLSESLREINGILGRTTAPQPQAVAAPQAAAPTPAPIQTPEQRAAQPLTEQYPVGPGLPPRAAGGDAMALGGYLVGERGTELFVPSQSGHIFSHDQTVKMLGARQEGGDVERQQEPGIFNVPVLGGLAKTAVQDEGLGGAALRGVAAPLLGPAAIAGVAAPNIARFAQENPALTRGAIGALILGSAVLAAAPTGGASVPAGVAAAGAVGATGAAGAAGATGAGLLGIAATGSLGIAGAATGFGLGQLIPGANEIRGAAQQLPQGVIDANRNLGKALDQVSGTLGRASRDWPGPLQAVGRTASDLARNLATAESEFATEKTGQNFVVPGQPAAPLVTPGQPSPTAEYQAAHKEAVINQIGGVGERPYGPLPGATAVSLATVQQTQAQLRATEAQTRLQQTQAQQGLRLYDVNRSNITIDGQRVSAQEALNRAAQTRLTIEGQLAPILLQQQRIQDQITIRTQENLELRRNLLEAQRAELPAGAAVERIGFQTQQARLRITASLGQIAQGQQPQYNIAEQIQTIFKNAPVFTAPQQLKELEAQQNVYEAGLQTQNDQLTKAVGAIPFEQQAQANQQAILVYQEQISAAQASSDAVTRVLQMADLIADPARIQAQKDLNQATLDAANAASVIAQAAVSNIPGQPAVAPATNQGQAPAPTQALPFVTQPPALPGPGTPGAQGGTAAAVPTVVVQAANVVIQSGPASQPAPATSYVTPGNNLQPRAAGGDIIAHSSYRVGEQGTELFVPSQSRQTLFMGARADGGPVSNAVFDLSGNAQSMARHGSHSPVGGVSVNVNMGDVSIQDGQADLESFRSTLIDAATRGTLQAIRQGRTNSYQRVPPTIAAGKY